MMIGGRLSGRRAALTLLTHRLGATALGEEKYDVT